jgi:hypothetical protein
MSGQIVFYAAAPIVVPDEAQIVTDACGRKPGSLQWIERLFSVSTDDTMTNRVNKYSGKHFA